MRIRVCCFTIGVRTRSKPPTAERRKSYRDPSSPQVAASLLYDIPSHPAGKNEGNVVACLGGESELRFRSYGVFHRIYESMVLGMPPVFAYPRRSRVAPSFGLKNSGGRVSGLARCAPVVSGPCIHCSPKRPCRHVASRSRDRRSVPSSFVVLLRLRRG